MGDGVFDPTVLEAGACSVMGVCSLVPKAFCPEVMPIARPHIALPIAGHMST